MLTATSQYALQAIVYLAEHTCDGAAPTRRVAKETDIPPRYLSAILATLVRNGVLTASPGTNGGYVLARRPSEILLWDVLESFEPMLGERRPCPFGKAACSDEDPCDGHKHWKKVRESYLAFVYETSLYDVMGREAQLAEIRSRKRHRSLDAKESDS